MFAFGYAGETGVLEAWTGFVFGIEAMLALGYAGWSAWSLLDRWLSVMIRCD